MVLQIQRKGKKILLTEDELHEYMDIKINEISRLASSIILALIMITMVAILTIFKAGDIYLYALILLPLVGRVYVGDMILRWLRKKFQDLIGI
ncbi:MAG: hypothetical protein ISS65_08850 [Desulfobacterales bacterium]|uniref:Uncharacterized protein n=1 Tax=Candidatus Desulfatibia profunda TaxID=2841695 RepID=A0A8J6NVR8_9BACT|nr:hypothetical protein [Candidatus Desulfatibia profunda]MBL7180299.1 hypothetical protein [Desulfobacterales bacterium]